MWGEEERWRKSRLEPAPREFTRQFGGNWQLDHVDSFNPWISWRSPPLKGLKILSEAVCGVFLINKCLGHLYRFIPSKLTLLKVKVLVAGSGPTLCDALDCNPPGSSIHGILQARILGCTRWSGLPSPSPGNIYFGGGWILLKYRCTMLC